MQYVSTRGEAAPLNFCDVLLTGLARDRGLYVPQTWPHFSHAALQALAGASWNQVALEVMKPFIDGEIGDEELGDIIAGARSSFRHPAVVPLVQMGSNQWLLELFHGPTLAFKDVAMQILARLMESVLKRKDMCVTIVGATSGDTGGAAIEAFRTSSRAQVFMLYPHGKVSDVQRRQMTTVTSDSVHTIALEGTFDDCQTLVKDLFSDLAFRDEMALAGVNSINWARILAQIVYYFTSALALGGPGRAMRYCVPTGNFGDIFAGWCARQMGLPISHLHIATNSNDILVRTLETGRYAMAPVEGTTSPSMDIQISSNFERLIFEASDRDPGLVRGLMSDLAHTGSFTLPPAVLSRIRHLFGAGRAEEAAVASVMRETLAETGLLLDPHSAVGVHCAKALGNGVGKDPLVVLATAHAAKFPDAVEAATGVRPGLPSSLSGLLNAAEKFTVLPNDVAQIKAFIRSRRQG